MNAEWTGKKTNWQYWPGHQSVCLSLRAGSYYRLYKTDCITPPVIFVSVEDITWRFWCQKETSPVKFNNVEIFPLILQLAEVHFGNSKQFYLWYLMCSFLLLHNIVYRIVLNHNLFSHIQESQVSKAFLRVAYFYIFKLSLFQRGEYWEHEVDCLLVEYW